MAHELQRPRVIEIQVRMDCNGCVQRIKKTLNNIDGINDLYFDLPQQKITIVGWADPEYIIKAIRRTKRNPTIICSPETEPKQSPSEQQAPDATQKQEEDEPPEKLQAEPYRDPPPPPQPEQPPEATALAKHTGDSSSQQSQSRPESEDEGEVHETYQHPHNYGSCLECDGKRNRYHTEAILQEPPTPIYVNVTHCYNTYQPPPYVTEYEYVRSSSKHTHYSRMERYGAEYYNEHESFTSMFSDENPNSCTIV